MTADADTHAKIAAAIAAAENVPASQVFQIILLQAENNGDAGLDRVPGSARGALEDAREFLPYSGHIGNGMTWPPGSWTEEFKDPPRWMGPLPWDWLFVVKKRVGKPVGAVA